MSNNTNGYLEPITDTSYGTRSSDVARDHDHTPVKGRFTNGQVVHNGGTLRANVTTIEHDGSGGELVVLADGSKTSLTAAKAAGLPYTKQTTEITVEGETPSNDMEVGKEAEPGVSTEVATKANAELDAVAENLNSQELALLTNDAIQGDERALEIVEKHAPNVYDAYVDRGSQWAEAYGGAELLTEWMDQADQAQARAAVVNNDKASFDAICMGFMQEMEGYVQSDEFRSDMRASGYTIDGGGHVFDQEDGSHLGHVKDLLLSGRLERL